MSFKYTKTILPGLLAFMLLVSPGLFAQQGQITFEIDSVGLNQEFEKIDLFIRLLQDGEPLPGEDLRMSELQVFEQIQDEPEVKLALVDQPQKKIVYDTLDTKEVAHLFFLVERSHLLSESDVNKVESLIKELKSDLQKSPFRYYFSYFDSTLGPERPFNTEEEEQALIKDFQASTSAGSVSLFEAIFKQLQRLNDYTGKKIIILLTKGQNESKEDLLSTTLPYTAADVSSFLKELGPDVLLFPVGIGAGVDEPYLQSIVGETANSNDKFTNNDLPDNLLGLIQENIVIRSTHVLTLVPENEIYRGEKRTIRVVHNSSDIPEASLSFEKGSGIEPVILQRPPDLSVWALWLVIGVLLLSVLLAVIFLLIPVIRKWQFDNKYVKLYQPEGNRRSVDPLTNEPIMAGEKVVHKCQQVVPLATWEGLGGQCPNYPDCLDYMNCNGAGGPEKTEGLFSMQGIYRNLNWLWFGALGGFIGWMLYAVFRNIGLEWYRSILSGVFSSGAGTLGSKGDLQAVNQWMEGLVNNTLIGVAFGIGFILMLTIVEERSQSRRQSWLRVLLRVVMGIILSLGVFWLGYYLEKNVISSIYLSGLVTWLLFGLVVGLVLAFNSSISMLRGVLGGVLASVVGYQFYWLLGDVWQDFIAAKLISLIVMGAILGWIIVTVISSLEDFELEYVSPSNVSNNIIPISKWLKSGLEVLIGTSNDCYVYVKWQDGEVAPIHAKLTMDNGKVFLMPIAETLVRGYPSPKGQKIALRDGDVIQLGKESITRMRFRAK